MGFVDSQVKTIRFLFAIKSLTSFLPHRSTFRVEELNKNIQEHFDIYGNAFVHTVDSARAQYFLRYGSLAKVNILLSGTTGSSKTFIVDSFLSGLGSFLEMNALF